MEAVITSEKSVSTLRDDTAHIQKDRKLRSSHRENPISPSSQLTSHKIISTDGRKNRCIKRSQDINDDR
jgi:hypothetical protein